jgi:hypothetical protein
LNDRAADQLVPAGRHFIARHFKCRVVIPNNSGVPAGRHVDVYRTDCYRLLDGTVLHYLNAVAPATLFSVVTLYPGMNSGARQCRHSVTFVRNGLGHCIAWSIPSRHSVTLVGMSLSVNMTDSRVRTASLGQCLHSAIFARFVFVKPHAS